jgi:hypothetical protein
MSNKQSVDNATVGSHRGDLGDCCDLATLVARRPGPPWPHTLPWRSWQHRGLGDRGITAALATCVTMATWATWASLFICAEFTLGLAGLGLVVLG